MRTRGVRVCLDIETRKVPVDPPILSRGRQVTKRWQVFMIGTTTTVGTDEVDLWEGSEETILQELEQYLELIKATEIIYEATRKIGFDEAILKGIFINERRELLEKPGPWPRLRTAHLFKWTNLRGYKPGVVNPFGLSKVAPLIYGTDPELIRNHCRWDVVNLLSRARDEQA